MPIATLTEKMVAEKLSGNNINYTIIGEIIDQQKKFIVEEAMSSLMGGDEKLDENDINRFLEQFRDSHIKELIQKYRKLSKVPS